MNCVICGNEVKEGGKSFLEVDFGVCEDCLLTDEEIVDFMRKYNKETMFKEGYVKFGLIRKYLGEQVRKVLRHEYKGGMDN